jgi:peptidylprolyl isomerase
LIVMLLLSGCSSSPAEDLATPAPVLTTSGQPEELTYAPSLGVDLTRMTRTASGLYYQDLLAGNGAVAAGGQYVRVNYIGWLADGREFDRSRDGRPLTVQLGQGRLIQGWEEGLIGMRAGGRRLLVIPPELAYGNQSPAPSVPANATLIFDVQLVQVRP